MKVWKFRLPLDSESVSMPEGAEVLHVGEQYDVLCVWALCDPSREQVERRFVVRGTGHSVPDERGRFLGTVLLLDGTLVLHVWEVSA